MFGELFGVGAAGRVPLHDAPNRKSRNILIINNKMRFMNFETYFHDVFLQQFELFGLVHLERTKHPRIKDAPVWKHQRRNLTTCNSGGRSRSRGRFF